MARTRSYSLHARGGKDRIQLQREEHEGAAPFSTLKISINGMADEITIFIDSNTYPNFPTYDSNDEQGETSG